MSKRDSGKYRIFTCVLYVYIGFFSDFGECICLGVQMGRAQMKTLGHIASEKDLTPQTMNCVDMSSPYTLNPKPHSVI